MGARITTLTAPAGAGKSRALRAILCERLRAGTGHTVLMLVPTAADAREAVHSLLDRIDGVLVPPVANFYEFVARILEHNQHSGREISPPERDLLLENIIEKLASQGKIEYFAPLLRFRGLASAIGGFIKELKQNTIYPERFLEYSGRGPDQKGAEIAAIYAEYQRVLKHADLYDTEGKLWRVRDLIMNGRRKPYDDVKELFVDDFADFTPSEFDIIKALAGHVEGITFALTHEDGERRGELFATTSSTIALIEKEFPEAKRESIEPVKPPPTSLDILEHNLFDPLAGQQDAPDDGIHIIRCPDRSAEVTETGRRIKDLLLEGRKADDIVVIVRSPARYAPLFEEVFREQGIPFTIGKHKRLAEIPVVRSILHLLEIPGDGFSRHAVMRFLGSPYAGALIGEFDAAAVDEVSREAQVVAGADSWRGRIRSYVKRLEDSLENPDMGEDLPQDAGDLRSRLTCTRRVLEFTGDFLAKLEKLQQGCAIAEHVDRVLGLIDRPALRQACMDSELPENTGADLAALEALRAGLRRLSAFAEILGSADEEISCEKFIEYLRRLLDCAIDTSRVKPEGRVRIMDVPGTRGMFFPVVFVCGLVEKEFPEQVSQSPFYNDSARRHLNRSGRAYLKERGDDQKFEMFLFYTAVTRATERLYLTHPTADAEGREALPSYYLAEVERLYTGLSAETISLGRVLPRHEDAVGAREMLAAALADGMVPDARPATFLPQCLQALARCAMPPLAAVARALAVEHERGSFRPYGIHDGVIRDEKIKKRLEARMRETVFSASRLGRYGSCPFRYFTERVLGLAEIVEPEDELTSINRGRFFHALLRDFFVCLQERGSTVITEKNKKQAIELIEQLAEEHFEHIRKNGAVANEVVFQAEQSGILEELRAFVDKETATNSNDKTRTEPEYFELAFGFDEMLKKWDVASTKEPLVIEGGEFPVKIRGVIDRVDRRDDGPIVIDYKGSGASSKAAYLSGSDLQIVLYAVAVNELFAEDREVADGFYYPLKSLQQVGRLQFGNPKIPEIYDTVRQYAIKHVAAMCRGEFPPDPKDDFCKYCPARGTCRYSEARAERKNHQADETD